MTKKYYVLYGEDKGKTEKTCDFLGGNGADAKAASLVDFHKFVQVCHGNIPIRTYMNGVIKKHYLS